MQKKVDFLVIGSGIAGLSFALKVATFGKVAIITKKEASDTNTQYAQGGIASVMSGHDNFEKHIEDTLIAGDGICNLDAVKLVVEKAPQQIEELIKFGTNFDKLDDGTYDLAKEGGHSEHRILHFKDVTGREIERALVENVKKNPNIEILENYFALDLITQHHLGYTVTRYMNDIECYGAYVLNTNNDKIDTILAKTTLLATGGIGNIYNVTTNPPIATGDGIAMAYRAKAIIENMEFVQFHPTALFEPEARPSFLITEAMRGFGAILKTIDGKEFMHKYDKRGSLAPRDIVARSIDNEMKIRGEDYVLLDATNTDKKKLVEHFPNIYEKCLSLNIDITKDPIPVVPAAHYLCGGIKTDLNAQTTINRLYAAGECASTGLHGANRLASNSLIEAIVFADQAAKHALALIDNISFNNDVPDWDSKGTTLPEEMILITQEFRELQQIMTNYVGIVRSNLRLERAQSRLEILHLETETIYRRSIPSRKICELRNSINVAFLTIKMAKRRRESRGLHYNVDYKFKLNGMK
ncbi:MAG: L-aspartate oxidase [Bacteroidales bacterium]|nr:L-aspartate oxidase [Bacteroidales bacterium]